MTLPESRATGAAVAVTAGSGSSTMSRPSAPARRAAISCSSRDGRAADPGAPATASAMRPRTSTPV